MTSGLDIKVRTMGTGSAIPWQQQKEVATAALVVRRNVHGIQDYKDYKGLDVNLAFLDL